MLGKVLLFFSHSVNVQGNCPMMFLFGKSGWGKKHFVLFLAKKLQYKIVTTSCIEFQDSIQEAKKLIIPKVNY